MKTTITLILSSVLAACATTSSAGVKDPEGYAAEKARQEALNESIAKDARFIPRVMQGMDKAIDKYFTARLAAPDDRATRLADTLDMTIRREVRKNFELLITKSMDPTPDGKGDRGIALVALGFSDATEERFESRGEGLTMVQKQVRTERARKFANDALNSLTTALADPDEEIINNALLGLGLLAHEQTPVQEIGTLLEDTKRSLDIRRNASWTLSVVHEKLTPKKREPIRPIFLRVLMQPLGEVEPPVLSHALRTIGHFRNKRDAEVVDRYVEHPSPLIRVRAAIAIGQIKNPASHPSLLELIKPKETNQNVRLAARKSLKALAGGLDRGYDVKQWQKVFALK